MKYLTLLFLAICFLASCTKTETPSEYTKTTFTNYHGYFSYCHYGSNEIDTELKEFKSEKVILFEYEAIKDTTYCRSFTCPRNGQMEYLTRITIE